MPPSTATTETIRVRAHWQALDIEADAVARYASVLSDSEQRRARRFHFQRDRDRYIVRRGRLRELLAEELGNLPRQVRLACNRFGKPRVDGTDIEFSLSHSAGLALYVIDRGLAIGCDIEWRIPMLATAKLAEQFFAPREVAALAALPAALREEGFFNCWTRKEAYLKALGLGLSVPLGSFAVSLAPGEPAELLQCAGDKDTGSWSLASLAPAAGLHVAIAARGRWQLAAPLDPLPAG